MSYKTVEIGLPFFDDINKQTRKKSYFNAYYKEWLCPENRLPSFQFVTYQDDSIIDDFDLINVDTGATTDYKVYFNANVDTKNRDIYGVYFSNDGSGVTTLTTGRYYLYAKSSEGRERFSEVFVVRDLNITANPSAKEFRTIEIGLPFFDNINKQMRYSPYFNSHIKDWLSADNRFLPFQICLDTSSSGLVSFDLINSITGATTDYLTYFGANTTQTDLDPTGTHNYYITHLGLADVVVSGGRYYFYAVGVNGRKWWSEEFTMCGDITTDTDYLLISKDDYLLISATDKLIIG